MKDRVRNAECTVQTKSDILTNWDEDGVISESDGHKYLDAILIIFVLVI